MSKWKHNIPHQANMPPVRCDEEGVRPLQPYECGPLEPFDHEPHEWYNEHHDSSIVIDGHQVRRVKTTTLSWYWCPGHLSPVVD